MKERISNCTDITVCGRKDLLVDNEYIDQRVMDKKCSMFCQKRRTCLDILKLLSQGERKQAQDLLSDKKYK